MVKSIYINQIATNGLSCEPLLKRTANGELLCVCQCGGNCEPSKENREFFFHSKDNGRTWSEQTRMREEDGKSEYCTSVDVNGDEITAYMTYHSGHFLDWKCVMAKSYDNGYTWKDSGEPPFFPTYAFIRNKFVTKSGTTLIPYHAYPITKEMEDEARKESGEDAYCWYTHATYCEVGVIATDDYKTFTKYEAGRIDITDGWSWSENTIAQLSDGKLVMLMRRCGRGCLLRTESTDNGKTWSPIVDTDIPNPSNKPTLLQRGNTIALLHTPSKEGRFPLQLWISKDDMKTWEKTTLTDFPGRYDYTDGIFEEGHIRFTIERCRHDILFFDVELE